MVTSESIVEEMKAEHGILSCVVPCPCSTDANSLTGRPKPACPYCLGYGKIQYGIDDMEFYS